MVRDNKVNDFLKKLISLVKKEKELQIEAMKSEIKRMSGERREKVGRAVLNLKGKVISTQFGYNYVKYGRAKDIETEISQGDVVLVSKMGSNPLKSNLTATVADKGRRFLVLAFEKSVPEWALKNVRIDLYSSETTFNRMLDTLNCLLREERGCAISAIKLYLSLIKIEKGEKVEFEPFDKLNGSQLEAISLAIGSEFFAIHGPFGTGKTKTAAELVRQLICRGERVLATASSNIAVDNFMNYFLKSANKTVKAVRIGHPARMSKELVEHSLPYLAERHPDYREVREIESQIKDVVGKRDLLEKPKPKWRRGLSDEEIVEAAEKGIALRGIPLKVLVSMAEWIRLNKEVEKLIKEKIELEKKIQSEILREANVVFSTNSTSFILREYGLEFDRCVIDEASQSSIPETLIPLSISRKFVLVGDHKQLPPTVEVKELEKTLFEKLVELNSSMLRIQYRMNEDLMEFPCKAFYNCKLRADESVKNLKLEVSNKIILEKPLQFIDTSKSQSKWERRRKGSPSKENPLEARIVEKVVKELLKLDIDESRIGVITPYDDQAELIRKFVSCEVNTVDAFQGREKDIIILSFVRSNREGKIGFLMDERRLNVSLTRARMKLIAIGDSETLSNLRLYSQMIEHFKNKGCFMSSEVLLNLSK